MSIEAAIFDLDGTLLDSSHLWAQIDIDFLAKRGLSPPPGYIETLSSLSFFQAAQYTIQQFHLPEEPETILQEWNQMAAYAYGHTIPLKKRAKEYLLKLKQAGIKLGIATSLPSALYLPALKNHTIHQLFDATCSTNEVSRGKEYPDIYLYTAAKLNVQPQNCIVFEDIPQAIKSAKKAGMTVYGVYDDASKALWNEIGQLADGLLYTFQEAPLPV